MHGKNICNIFLVASMPFFILHKVGLSNTNVLKPGYINTRFELMYFKTDTPFFSLSTVDSVKLSPMDAILQAITAKVTV